MTIATAFEYVTSMTAILSFVTTTLSFVTTTFICDNDSETVTTSYIIVLQNCLRKANDDKTRVLSTLRDSFSVDKRFLLTEINDLESLSQIA